MKKIAVILCALCFISLSAYAAGPNPAIPDAGSLLREQQQKGPQLPDRLPKLDESEVERPALTDSGVKVVVKGFRFSGITGMATTAQLQELLKEAIGKEHTLSDLQRLAGLVTDYLRGKGFFLARAYLPKQDVTSGIIEIAVLGGRVDGGATIRAKEPRRMRTGILQKMIDSGVKPGEALHSDRLARSLMLVNDLPGISAKGTLERGATYGSTKVLIDVAEGPLLGGGLTGDNFGNRYTGVWRGTGYTTINDPLGIGDQLSISLTGTEGLFQGRAGYSTQLHSSGLKGGISYTGLYYKLGSDLEILKANGRADTIGANLTYPILRSRAFSLWQNLSYEYRMMKDYANDALTRSRDIQAGNFDLTGSGYDSLGGGGLTSIRLAITAGYVQLGVQDDAAADATTAKSAGNYYKFGYSVARLQRLIGDFSLFASVSGQLAGSNLDSSEKFILGGPTGVRSYPVGEASGDEGHSFNTELRYDLPIKGKWGTPQLVGFFDVGNISLHRTEWTNSVTTATGKNNYWLSGGGLGLNISKPELYALRASWAHTIGDNPGRSIAGNNADNYKEDNRFWLQAAVWF
jgi:hemolysin activation/secretion protein